MILFFSVGEKVSRLKVLYFFALFLFFASPGSAEESGSDPPHKAIIINERSQFGLAQYLFDEGDHFRAITEYKRFIYYFPGSSLSEMAYFKIGEAYFKGELWKQAVLAFEALRGKFPNGDLVGRSYYLSGRAHFYNKDFRTSRNQLQQIIEGFPKSDLVDDARLQIAMSYVAEEKWLDAAESLRAIGKASDLYDSSQRFAFGLDEVPKLPYKSPTLAGTFAAIVPGSGHFYAGRKKDGATAFLLNSVFIWGAVVSFDHEDYAVAGILTSFELGWYFGNIYSAVSSAHKHNKWLKKSYIRALREKENFSLHFNQVGKSSYLTFDFRF